MSFKVQIKWGKEKFPDVEIDTSEPVEVFRAQLYALSGVPPDRQKVMAKGKTLKDQWAGFEKILKNNIVLMMMGSADPLYKPPEKKTVFIEDMDEGEQQKAAGVPLGLENLGNTCYMNACIQCFRACPALVKGLTEFNQTNKLTSSDQEGYSITQQLKDLSNLLTNSTQEHVTPMMMVMTLRQFYPHFGERDPQSQAPMQQDANECWTLMMRGLQAMMKPTLETIPQSNLIDQYFSIEFTSKLKCTESETEPVTTMKETELQLSCFLDKEVKYLMSGIKNKMSGELEKRASTLERNAVFEKQSEITRLPAYLAVQMVRFFYKEGKQGASGTNAKILKDVKFPQTLDMFELCSDELKENLSGGRKRFEVYTNWQKDQIGKRKLGDATAEDEKPPTFLETEDTTTTGSNLSGYYELYGVLTHKGRSSSSGHYVAWTRPDPTNDNWFLFDDENVSPVKEEDVLKLSGGGDWHMSYVLLYGPKRINPGHASMKIEEVDAEIERITNIKQTSSSKKEEKMDDK